MWVFFRFRFFSRQSEKVAFSNLALSQAVSSAAGCWLIPDLRYLLSAACSKKSENRSASQIRKIQSIDQIRSQFLSLPLGEQARGARRSAGPAAAGEDCTHLTAHTALNPAELS
jgi:hypothetical protein